MADFEENKTEETVENTEPVEARKEPEYDEVKDAQDNKAMGILAYIGLLVLVPIFAAKDSKFARYHANQGLVLTIIAVGAIILLSLFGLIPYVGIVFNILAWLIEAAYVVLAVFGIISAAKGEKKELPVVGQYISKIQILK